jgi:hypothetical protein
MVFPVTLAKAIGLKVRNSPDNSAMLSLKILILSPLIRIKAVPKWKCQIDITSGLDWKQHFIYPHGKQKRNLSKRFKKVKKKNVFVLLTQVLCMKLAVSGVACMMRILKKERTEKN